MCGDTGCPSCGPAQGHYPEEEVVCEYLGHLIDQDEAFGLCRWIDTDELTNVLVVMLGQDPILCDALVEAATKWQLAETRKRRLEQGRRWVAVVDGNTCASCQGRHGMTRSAALGIRCTNLDGCRCTLTEIK